MLKVVIEKLVFNATEAQIFYRQINLRSDGGDSSKTSNRAQNVLVVLDTRRKSQKEGVQYPPLVSDSGKDFFSHNAKVVGWYIGLNGCRARLNEPGSAIIN